MIAHHIWCADVRQSARGRVRQGFLIPAILLQKLPTALEIEILFRSLLAAPVHQATFLSQSSSSMEASVLLRSPMSPEKDLYTDKSEERGLLAGPTDFVHSAAFTFAQLPMDGIAQTISRYRDRTVDAPQLVSRPEHENLWTMAGSTTASVGHFILATKAIKGKPGTVTAMEAGSAGALVEFLQPVTTKESSFWWAKARNSGVAFGTFATMVGTNHLADKAGLVGRAGRRSIAESIGLNTLSGLNGGLAHTQLDAMGHGKLFGNINDYTSNGLKYAAFGALFGGAEATLYRAKYLLKPAENAPRTGSLKTTEQWVMDYKTGGEPLQSPLLNWIAENRPKLRPPNYESYKAQMRSTPIAEMKFLDLAAWPVSQRPALLKEIRKLASSTQMSKDANIDAFITRMNTPELRAYSAPERVQTRTDAYSKWAESSGRLDKIIEADPVLREMTHGKLFNSKDLIAKNPSLKTAIDEVAATEKAYAEIVARHVKETNVEVGVTNVLNSVASDIGLTRLNSVKVQYDKGGNAWYKLDQVGLGERVAGSGLSAESADATIHEFVHHETASSPWRWSPSQKPGDPVGAQVRLADELQRLKQPGGTLDLLQRLSKGGVTNYHVSARYGMPENMQHYLRMTREGQINTARWDEAAINKELSTLLETRLGQARTDAWNQHMSYVGTSHELKAWSTGFLTRVRARVMGLPDGSTAPPQGLPSTISILEHTTKAKDAH